MGARETRATRLLQRLDGGDPRAGDELMELVHAELHGLARGMMRGEAADHTLQPTALLNEAWMRLLGDGRTPGASDRAHFLRLSARAMRRVLIDHARARRRLKRGEGRTRIELDDAWEDWQRERVDVLELEEVLQRLEQRDAELARVVELRFFCGLTAGDTAEALGVSEESVRWSWRLARAWLRRELERGDAAP